MLSLIHNYLEIKNNSKKITEKTKEISFKARF